MSSDKRCVRSDKLIASISNCEKAAPPQKTAFLTTAPDGRHPDWHQLSLTCVVAEKGDSPASVLVSRRFGGCIVADRVGKGGPTHSASCIESAAHVAEAQFPKLLEVWLVLPTCVAHRELHALGSQIPWRLWAPR